MRKIDKQEALQGLREGVCAMCALHDAHPHSGLAIAENEHAIATLDAFAARPGHALIVLRRHEERITRLPWAEYGAMQQLAHEVARAIEEILGARRMWIAALGSPDALVASFPHVHLHVLPIVVGGEDSRPAKVLSWSEGVWVFEPGEGEALAARVRRALAQSG